VGRGDSILFGVSRWHLFFHREARQNVPRSNRSAASRTSASAVETLSALALADISPPDGAVLPHVEPRARDTGLAREGLYEALSPQENPESPRSVAPSSYGSVERPHLPELRHRLGRGPSPSGLARAMTRMSAGIPRAEPMRETAALRWTTGSRRDWAWTVGYAPSPARGRRVIPAEPALGKEGEGIRSDASAYPVSEGRRSEDGPQAVRKGPFCAPTSPAPGDKRSTGGTRCDSARRKSP